MRGVIYSETGKSSLGLIQVLICEDCGHPIGTVSIERKVDKDGKMGIYQRLTILDEDIFNNVDFLDGDINGDFIVNCKCGCKIEMKRFKTGGGLEVVKNGKIQTLSKYD